MADEETTATETTEEQGMQQQEAPETKADDKTPSWEKAAESYKQQRDESRKKVEELTKQLETMKSKGDIDAFKAELEKTKAEAEQAAQKANRDRLNTVRLAQAGCVDIEVALTLIDEDGDVDALKESKPYLFGAKTGSTGFKPDGTTNNDDEQWMKASKASHIPVDELRKRAK